MSFYILVIDDSPVVRTLVETALHQENADYVVQGFATGEDALSALLQPRAIVPDLIFLDIALPRMNGYQVAIALRERPQFAATAIVMLTRRDGVIDKLKSKLVGARVHMTKPFKTADITSTAHKVLRVR